MHSAYTLWMIQSWRHKGLSLFCETGSTAGIRPHDAEVIRAMLFQLSCAVIQDDMNTPY